MDVGLGNESQGVVVLSDDGVHGICHLSSAGGTLSRTARRLVILLLFFSNNEVGIFRIFLEDLLAGGVLVRGLGSPVGAKILLAIAVAVFQLVVARLVVVQVNDVVDSEFLVGVLFVNVDIMLGKDGGSCLFKPEKEGLVFVLLHLLHVLAVLKEIPISAAKQDVLVSVVGARDSGDDGQASQLLLGHVAVIVEILKTRELVSGWEGKAGSQRGLSLGCLFARGIGRFTDNNIRGGGKVELDIRLLDGIGDRMYRVGGADDVLI